MAVSINVPPSFRSITPALQAIHHLNTGEYLVELTENKLAEDLIENGFGLGELHMLCTPPRLLCKCKHHGPSRLRERQSINRGPLNTETLNER